MIVENYRNPKRTNWDSYKLHLKGYDFNSEDEIRTVAQLEKASSELITAITNSYTASCPAQQRSSNREVSWWNEKLAVLRKKSRRLFNRAKKNWRLGLIQ